MGSLKSVLLLSAGWLCVALATAGVFLPLLPTTPFLLVAAWCFAQSSERLHGWLLNQPGFGPLISDWERDGVIRLRAKLVSSIVLVGVMSIPLSRAGLALPYKIIGAVTATAVLAFLWSRPSTPRDEPATG